MSDLEKVCNWLLTFPKIDRIQGLGVDYYSTKPNNGSVDPAGLVEISRNEDILGNVTVRNQYNFVLYFVLAKSPEDNKGATENANWLLELQRWIQEQSIRRKVPTFGDDPKTETIRAQNGKVDSADEEGTALYSVLLSIEFTKIYKET